MAAQKNNVLDFINRQQRSMDGGGEPPHNDRMEARINTLEEAVKNLPTKADMTELRLANKADFAELRADMHKNNAEIQRWMIATVIALFLGFSGLFFTMNNSTKPSAPTQQPIIINVPAASPTPPAPTHQQ